MGGLQQKLPLIPIPFIRQGHRRFHVLTPALRIYNRIEVQEAASAQSFFKSEEFKAKHSPGRFELGRVSLPDTFLETVKKILSHENVKDLSVRAEELSRYLFARRLPIENDEYRAKVEHIESEFLAKESILEPFLSAKQKLTMEKARVGKIKKKLKKQVYHWEPVEFTHSKALEYLIARIPAQYAALSRIFYEISARDPAFQPNTLFDFGSGIGSVVWAAQKYWSKSLAEHMCVDASKEMNDIAELICKKGISTANYIFPNIYFRQFLATTTDRKYDLCVSSYSMMELPSAKSRIEILDNLWKRTRQYLVLVEPGSNAGFEALNEARDYILGLHGQEPNSSVARGHIFSPCPHDSDCPRYSEDKTPCNFTVRYRPLLPFHQENTEREVFSYVVFKKGERNGKAERWPRVVREPLCRHHHVICRLCTKEGNLSEAVITRGKHSRPLYRCAKKLTSGDLLPVQDKEPGATEDTVDVLVDTSPEESTSDHSDPESDEPSSAPRSDAVAS